MGSQRQSIQGWVGSWLESCKMRIRSSGKEERHRFRGENLLRGESAGSRKRMFGAYKKVTEEEKAGWHVKAGPGRQGSDIKRISILGLCNRMIFHWLEFVLYLLCVQIYLLSENSEEARAAMFILVCSPLAFIVELATRSQCLFVGALWVGVFFPS